MERSRREEIIRLLKEKPRTIDELCRILEIYDKKAILQDLKFIAKRKKFRLLVEPARCKNCGYEFKPELKNPSKCPKCKSQYILKPRFFIEK